VTRPGFGPVSVAYPSATRGTALATSGFVMSIVDLVYQYRTLAGRCELGTGLEFDDIALLTELEASFVPGRDDLHARDGRKHRREPVVLHALVRGADLNDRVAVRDLGPGGLMIAGAPYANEGDHLEIVIDAERRSYRFKAEVRWLKDDGDDYQIGLRFVGLPVCLNYGPELDLEVEIENVVDLIAA